MRAQRCPACGRVLGDLTCLVCGGRTRTGTHDPCPHCGGRGRETRCPELLEHLDAELHQTFRQYSMTPRLPAAGVVARSPAGRPDARTQPASLMDVHDQEAARSQKLYDRPIETHQRTVESGQRMRQAPRHQKRMPRTKKEASR